MSIHRPTASVHPDSTAGQGTKRAATRGSALPDDMSVVAAHTHPGIPSPVTHGWRWYRVVGDRLVSPLAGRMPLPRDGLLNSAYFIPSVEAMSRVANMIHGQQWYELALTFGAVTGPFAVDNDMPRVGSLRSSQYRAQAILSTSPHVEALALAYDMPVFDSIALPVMAEVDEWLRRLTIQPAQDQGVLRVVFVCNGNICRSPMAEKMFAQQIAARGLADQVHVTSAGLRAWRSCIDPRAAAVLRAHGYPADHRVTQLTTADLRADLVVPMTGQQAYAVVDYGVPAERLRPLRSFDPTAELVDVADPYYGDTGGFETTHDQLAAALPGLHRWVDTHLRDCARAGRPVTRPADARMSSTTRARTAVLP